MLISNYRRSIVSIYVVCFLLSVVGLRSEILGFEIIRGDYRVDELRTSIMNGGRDIILTSCSNTPASLRTHPWLTEQAIKVFQRTHVPQ